MAGMFALPFLVLAGISYYLLEKNITNYEDDKSFEMDLYLLKTSFIGTIVAWIGFYAYLFVYRVPGEYFLIPWFSLIPIAGGGVGYFVGAIINEHFS